MVGGAVASTRPRLYAGPLSPTTSPAARVVAGPAASYNLMHPELIFRRLFHEPTKQRVRRGFVCSPVGACCIACRCDQPADRRANQPRNDGPGATQPRVRARLVARGDSGRPPRSVVEVSGRRLHSAQSERADGARCVRDFLPERRRREAGEPDPRDTRSATRRQRRERRFRVLDLRAGVAGSARRDEDLPPQFVRGAAPCERQGPGALGQLQADGGAARRSETCAVRATRKSNGARQPRHLVGR